MSSTSFTQHRSRAQIRARRHGIAALALALILPALAEARPLQNAAGAWELEVLVDGVPAPRFHHAAETYVLGHPGQRYTLRVWNRSPRRIEAVVSVDGRDVVDGKPGDFRTKGGYVVQPYGFVDIDGWRVTRHEAAAFRFTSVANSYAGRMGNARNVGVIGVAIFPERVFVPPPRPLLRRRDHDHSRAPAEASGARAEGKAPSAPGAYDAPSARPGLGTEFGEAVDSRVHAVTFTRHSPTHPAALLGLRYNDRAGLVALGIYVDGHHHAGHDTWLRSTAEPFPHSDRRYATPPPGWRR